MVVNGLTAFYFCYLRRQGKQFKIMFTAEIHKKGIKTKLIHAFYLRTLLNKLR